MENNKHLLPEDAAINLIPANPFKRLANYLTDFIVFSILLSFSLTALAPSSSWVHNLLYRLTNKPEDIGFMDQFMIWFIYGLYISAMEAILKGKTIGKYLTQTRAVTTKGYRIDAETGFTRGLIRLIPFEQFSAIGLPSRPWHDRWSKTMVVDERKSVFP